MSTNIYAQVAVMRNLAAGLSPTNHIKTVGEMLGYKSTLAALVRKRWVAVDADVAGRVRLTPLGLLQLSRRPDKR